MSDSIRSEQTRPAEATDGGLIRLGCCYCDRTDCDGISAFPTYWRHIQQVKVQGFGIWETHLGVCPECQKFEDDDFAAIDTGSPPREEGEAELEKPDSIHPIVRQIIDRDCHVSESNKDVVRHVISKLRDGYQSLRKMPAHDRRMLVEQCVEQHRSNFKEFVAVMSGFTRTVDQDPSKIALPSSLTGKEVVALMRKHKVTIESLAFRIGTSMKRIRKIRESGLQDVLAVRDWIQAITGEDPGPLPEKYRINNRQEEGSCCFCGYPLYIDDSAYEYVGSMFCSVSCCRKSRGG
jgi:hypothetical protein